MLRAWALLILAVFLAAATPIPVPKPPTLQPPIPSATEQSRVVQQPPDNGAEKTQSDKRGTDEAPLVVKVQHAETNEAEAKKDADYRERKTTDEWIVWWAGWAVGVSIVQALALIATFMVMAYVAIRQLRAYVHPSKLKVTQWGKNVLVEVSVTVENHGQTPAYDLVGYTWFTVAPHPLPKDFVFAEPQDPNKIVKSVIPPGTSKILHTGSAIPLTDEMREALKLATNLRMYVYGKITYRDAFRIRRHTHFRFEYDSFAFTTGEVGLSAGGNTAN